MNKKRIITGLAVLITLLVLFVLLLIFRGGSEVPADGTPDGSPFGSGDGLNLPFGNGSNTVGEVTPLDENITPEARLFRISNTPVAGFIPLLRGTTTVVRYVDRATGHINDFPLPKEGEPRPEEQKISNNTLTKIYEAHFRADGLAVLFRSLLNDTDEVENLILTLTPPRTTSTTTENLHAVAATTLRGTLDSVVAGNGNNLFYVSKDSSSIVATTFAATTPRNLYSSLFDGWRLAKAGNNVLAYTKASAYLPGYAYLINSATGAMTKIAGPHNGLVAIANPAGTQFLYSFSEGGLSRIIAVNTAGEELSEITPETIAEKCVWGNRNTAIVICGAPLNGLQGAQPDLWYRGASSFSDEIWSYNTSNQVADLLISPQTEFEVSLDIYEPKLSADDKYLIFINKIDMTLWAARLD